MSGGLQDNGGSLLLARRSDRQRNDGVAVRRRRRRHARRSGRRLQDRPGVRLPGDGGDRRTAGARTAPARSVRDIDPGDPIPRFIAPFEADTVNPDHWVAGGQYVWLNTRGFAIQIGRRVDAGVQQRRRPLDDGRRRARTTSSGRRGAARATRPASRAAISTNVGGTWHQLTLPAEFPEPLHLRPRDRSRGSERRHGLHRVQRLLAALGRRPGAGLGHLWKTTDGGATWADVSGNLPDVPVNDVVLVGAQASSSATDLGVVVSPNGGATWSRLGANLPYTTTLDVHLGPDEPDLRRDARARDLVDREAIAKRRNRSRSRRASPSSGRRARFSSLASRPDRDVRQARSDHVPEEEHAGTRNHVVSR